MNVREMISPGAWSHLLRRTPLRAPLGRLWGLVHGIESASGGVSTGYRPIADSAIDSSLRDGWRDQGIPLSQRTLVDQQLRDMHEGTVIDLFRVAAEAVRLTGVKAPSVLELGCASGYYGEVLTTLIGPGVTYSGMDFSAAMIDEARRRYPSRQFVQGDAVNLPFGNASYDILLSSALLLHVKDYPTAIRETARVARSWCIFHRTPVMRGAPTSWYEKLAYGVRVFEICFNETELLGLFATTGLELVGRLPIDVFELSSDSPRGEMVTYVCRKL
jgi:SAM-dependent methyltransferase